MQQSGKNKKRQKKKYKVKTEACVKDYLDLLTLCYCKFYEQIFYKTSANNCFLTIFWLNGCFF